MAGRRADIMESGARAQSSRETGEGGVNQKMVTMLH